MKFWIVAFLVLLVAGIAFGVARDLYSRRIASHAATVIAADDGGQTHKSPSTRLPQLRVTLADGRQVDVAATRPLPAPGTAVTVEEMAMPWGQIWFRLADTRD